MVKKKFKIFWMSKVSLILCIFGIAIITLVFLGYLNDDTIPAVLMLGSFLISFISGIVSFIILNMEPKYKGDILNKIIAIIIPVIVFVTSFLVVLGII